ncbi:MAG: SIS domain-containing protein [Bacteroidaceae bacterium]|nr:SIS domain-containing protein [Bacteroidaceae bacterium]
MNLTDNKYSQFALVREMMDTVQVVANFNQSCSNNIADKVGRIGNVLFTGEGSSRIFPAKNALRKIKEWGLNLNGQTDCSWQSSMYNLKNYAVFLASNSGQTKEIVTLAKKLAEENNPSRFGLSANYDTPLSKYCSSTHVLNCGWEQAVAATKSVVEQAMYYESVLWNIAGMDKSNELNSAAGAIEKALTLQIPQEYVEWAKQAGTIYFAGYNDGVAEELTLKTNEITRRKSDFLEGTYMLHGIEEVMQKNDIIFMIDPIEDETEKIKEYLVQRAGVRVVAIADHQTAFPTIIVPNVGTFQQYVYLCAGWNLLVEIGISLGIDLDHPSRARKVGNQFQ